MQSRKNSSARAAHGRSRYIYLLLSLKDGVGGSFQPLAKSHFPSDRNHLSLTYLDTRMRTCLVGAVFGVCTRSYCIAKHNPDCIYSPRRPQRPRSRKAAASAGSAEEQASLSGQQQQPTAYVDALNRPSLKRCVHVNRTLTSQRTPS